MCACVCVCVCVCVCLHCVKADDSVRLRMEGRIRGCSDAWQERPKGSVNVLGPAALTLAVPLRFIVHKGESVCVYVCVCVCVREEE